VLDRAAKKRYPDDRPFHDCDDGYPQAAPVGSFAPNRFGLNDMLGNVWEWTCSVHENPYGDESRVCAPPESRAPRVFRGGAWYIKPSGVRSAHRNAGMPSSQTVSIGFRVARDLD
jgi:serine/threonine-protein kinase PpkA